MIKDEILPVVFKIFSGKANRIPHTTFPPPFVVISQHNHNFSISPLFLRSACRNHKGYYRGKRSLKLHANILLYIFEVLKLNSEPPEVKNVAREWADQAAGHAKLNLYTLQSTLYSIFCNAIHNYCEIYDNIYKISLCSFK